MISKGLLVFSNSPKKSFLLLQWIRLLVFWGNLRTTKSPLEIIWPLVNLFISKTFNSICVLTLEYLIDKVLYELVWNEDKAFES